LNPDRPLTRADLDAIDGLRPSEWPPYRKTFEHYFSTTCCQPYGLEVDGRLAAMGTLIAFGTSGWIGQLVTAPDHRGRGLGTRMLGLLMDHAHQKGLVTVSLVATAQGQHLYSRAGFRIEGEYGFHHRSEGPLPPDPQLSPALVPWTPEDTPAIAVLDASASGEARLAYAKTLQAGGWLSRDRGETLGFCLPTWGEGLVVARTSEAGRALLHRRLETADRIVVPRENPQALTALEGWGYREVRRAKRMVWGPSLIRRPEWVWSRVGGNLG
jgi:GNAT superfamily N-acetyltransferase